MSEFFNIMSSKEVNDKVNVLKKKLKEEHIKNIENDKKIVIYDCHRMLNKVNDMINKNIENQLSPNKLVFIDNRQNLIDCLKYNLAMHNFKVISEEFKKKCSDYTNKCWETNNIIITFDRD